MDGILSQDEINALLSGMDLSGDSGSAGTTDTQEPVSGVSDVIDESLLTDTEKDAIGEIANISMGSSATTLYSLVNRKVNITTPVVTLANWDTVIEDYQKYDEKVEELGAAVTRYEEKIKELQQQLFALQSENENLNEKVNSDFVNGSSNTVDILKRIARLEKAVFNQSEE